MPFPGADFRDRFSRADIGGRLSRTAVGSRFSRIALGTHDEVRQPGALKAALAEFISTFIFVLAGQGAVMSFTKLTDSTVATPIGLLVSALAHAFGFFVAVSVAANISGGHVNPAVTFGALLGGQVTVFRGILYWVAQLLGSTVACLLLRFTTGLDTKSFGLPSDVSVWQAFVLEIALTFSLVYTVFATVIDPNKGSLGTISPIAIGFIVGANILVGGAFDGASMNPAVSFGPSLISWQWADHWVYWAGPLIGGGVAALVYDIFFITQAHEPLPTSEYP